jgi:hypothetical protein
VSGSNASNGTARAAAFNKNAAAAYSGGDKSLSDAAACGVIRGISPLPHSDIAPWPKNRPEGMD